MAPSNTAWRYINDNVKVRKELDLPAGAHLKCRRIMEEEMNGFKQVKQDLLDSYNDYYLSTRRIRKDAPQMVCSGARTSRQAAVLRAKPSTTLGLRTIPRAEAFIGFVDVRKKLRGYIGGVKKRECKFLQKG